MVLKKFQWLPNITKDSQRFPKNAKCGCTKRQILAPPYQDYAYPYLGKITEARYQEILLRSHKKTWHSKWCVRSPNDFQNITKDSQRFPENAKYGRTKCQILAPPYQDHAYPSLERLQRQGIRRSCRDPTCLGKITFLVNFQVNGYGTSEIVLYACDWCFWSTGMWHRCNACELAVYSTPLD